MDESIFNQRVDDTLQQIEEGLDALDLDIDYETSGGILTIEFANRSKIIINRQGPLQQIWVATRSGGFHFVYDAAKDGWHKDDDGMEFFNALEGYISDHAGQEIELER